MNYTITRRTPKSVTCPHCKQPSIKSSHTTWGFRRDRKGYFAYRGTGKGIKYMEYEHEYSVHFGMLKIVERACKSDPQAVTCEHEKLTSSGRCTTCRAWVAKVDFICTGCGKAERLLADKRHWCDCNPSAPFKMILNHELARVIVPTGHPDPAETK